MYLRKVFRCICSDEECVDLRWCRFGTEKVFRKSDIHEDEGDGDTDDDGVHLMKRLPSPARWQSRQCDNSKEGVAFVKIKAFYGGGDRDSGGFLGF
ncbi:unnamed protein product [Lactuca saligna]|uniref:Uncharacterized protein n=1 Tax=Lactuca saligna TaxID=75948 RepID=A0AA35YM61_LACSI|nr:unnamed protein product [Lactuca saligna]